MEFSKFEKNDPKSNRRCVYHSRVHPGETVLVQHGPQYFPIFVDIIRKFDPDIIIELGTLYGGMTLVLHEAMPDVTIHTFDKVPQVKNELFDEEKVFFHIVDVLKEESSELINVIEDYPLSRKFLYCDNGDKAKEIEMYAKYLYLGDLLGCHDWESRWKSKEKKSLPDFQKKVLPILKELDFFQVPENEMLRERDLFSRFWTKG